MPAITIRGLDAETVALLKKAARRRSMSMDRFAAETLRQAVGSGSSSPVEYHDLDKYFGIWDDQQCQQMMDSIKEQRKIDKELWQ
ncbi:MAG: antitoxin [Candidatus Sumerlaeota bacterium]|nr:antitoxin [Candidatus Sumerlaeota bacterium]